MFTRAQWKRMRELSMGLPPGVRGVCKSCGSLVIYETRETEWILHHRHPWCAEFTKLVEGRTEFLTASAVPVEELERAMAEQKRGAS